MELRGPIPPLDPRIELQEVHLREPVPVGLVYIDTIPKDTRWNPLIHQFCHIHIGVCFRLICMSGIDCHVFDAGTFLLDASTILYNEAIK